LWLKAGNGISATKILGVLRLRAARFAQDDRILDTPVKGNVSVDIWSRVLTRDTPRSTPASKLARDPGLS
jgi:hypothetical protein